MEELRLYWAVSALRLLLDSGSVRRLPSAGTSWNVRTVIKGRSCISAPVIRRNLGTR